MSISPQVHPETVHGSESLSLAKALSETLGPSALVQGPALSGLGPQTGVTRTTRRLLLLVLPRSTAEVAAALRLCNAHRQRVVIQGGLTGLAGGANPQSGEVAISLVRLNRIEELDAVGGTAVVQAGVTLQALQEAAAEHDLWFPLDLGARGSCHLGGNAATNAGGQRVLRFGMMRNLVLGLEVVLPDGTVLTMLDRMQKNNAGFDLKQLFIGSEGALGVITRLSLALVPKPAWQGSALCALADFPAALALLRHAKATAPGLAAFELMWQGFFEASAAARGVALPFAKRFPLYVLIECFAGSPEQGEATFEAMLASAMQSSIVDDAIVPQSQTQATQLWAYREGVSELLSLCKPCAAFDVSVAIQRMDALLSASCAQVCSWPIPSSGISSSDIWGTGICT